MFATDARKYIEKLIRLQKIIEQKGYRRVDQVSVSQARTHLKKQLDFYRYDTDEKMHGFWEHNRNEIRTLIPNDTSKSFMKLMNEFITLQNQY